MTIKDKKARLLLAQKSLLGVSIGDAFGESFFGERRFIQECIVERRIPDTSWEFTDDTVMSISVFKQLQRHGTIYQNELAQDFSTNHDLDPNRGYGATVRRIFRGINEGKSWRNLSKGVFDGMGSMGNGAAMRSSVIGAYFYDDLDRVIIEAQKAAEVTHSNKEGISGAIAIAVATAYSTRVGLGAATLESIELIELVAEYTPESDTRYKILRGREIPVSYHIDTIRRILGDGTKMTSQDTVPYAVWCSANNLKRFDEALWKGVSILGDRDTICAIIGGIVMMSSAKDTIPKLWLESVEKVEESEFIK